MELTGQGQDVPTFTSLSFHFPHLLLCFTSKVGTCNIQLEFILFSQGTLNKSCTVLNLATNYEKNRKKGFANRIDQKNQIGLNEYRDTRELYLMMGLNRNVGITLGMIDLGTTC